MLLLWLSKRKSLLKTCFARCEMHKPLENQKERRHTNQFKAETKAEFAALISSHLLHEPREGPILRGNRSPSWSAELHLLGLENPLNRSWGSKALERCESREQHCAPRDPTPWDSQQEGKVKPRFFVQFPCVSQRAGRGTHCWAHLVGWTGQISGKQRGKGKQRHCNLKRRYKNVCY